MLLIVCVVCFIMTMFLWLLTLLGAVPGAPNYSPWLAFFACLILGTVVFLIGGGIITVPTEAVIRR